MPHFSQPLGEVGFLGGSNVTLVPQVALFIRAVCKNCHCLRHIRRGNFTTRACHFPGFGEKGGPLKKASSNGNGYEHTALKPTLELKARPASNLAESSYSFDTLHYGSGSRFN